MKATKNEKAKGKTKGKAARKAAGKSGKGSKSAARSNDLKKLAARMRGIDLCMMTTHGAEGQLHTRPMSNNGEVDFDGNAWFFTSRDTRKVSEVEDDGRVSLSYVGGTKREPVWIAIEGAAEIVDDEDKKRELWVDELDRWFENGPEDPSVVLIHVVAEHATWWSGEEQSDLALG